MTTELRVDSPPPLRLPWVAGAVLAACVAAAVIGAVAAGEHSHVGSAPGAPRISTLIGYVAIATMLSLLVAGFVLFVVARPRRRKGDEPGDPPQGTRLERTLIQLALIALCLAPLIAILLLVHHRPIEPTTTGAGPLGIGNGRGLPPTFHGSGSVNWTFFFAFVVGAVVILGFVAVNRRRAAEVEEEPDDALEPVVAAGIEALESERDPRRAVIKAYAAMERTLAARELPRRPIETPLEYLRRMLEELGGRRDAASRLTRLFEEAKFSHHDIDERMRRDALSSLEALRA